MKAVHVEVNTLELYSYDITPMHAGLCGTWTSRQHPKGAQEHWHVTRPLGLGNPAEIGLSRGMMVSCAYPAHKDGFLSLAMHSQDKTISFARRFHSFLLTIAVLRSCLLCWVRIMLLSLHHS